MSTNSAANCCGVILPLRWNSPSLSRHCQLNVFGGVPKWMHSILQMSAMRFSLCALASSTVPPPSIIALISLAELRSMSFSSAFIQRVALLELDSGYAVLGTRPCFRTRFIAMFHCPPSPIGSESRKWMVRSSTGRSEVSIIASSRWLERSNLSQKWVWAWLNSKFLRFIFFIAPTLNRLRVANSQHRPLLIWAVTFQSSNLMLNESSMSCTRSLFSVRSGSWTLVTAF